MEEKYCFHNHHFKFKKTERQKLPGKFYGDGLVLNFTKNFCHTNKYYPCYDSFTDLDKSCTCCSYYKTAKWGN